MKTYWFDDGRFQFFTAVTRSEEHGLTAVIYRVREDSFPERRAEEKGIKYDYIRPSSLREIKVWMRGHPDFAYSYSEV